MDRNTRYRALIRELLQEMAGYNADTPSVHTELVFDEERGHYHYGEVGWDGDRRIDSVLVHIDLIGDIVWIQRNWTETRVAEELVKAGIPREHRPRLQTSDRSPRYGLRRRLTGRAEATFTAITGIKHSRGGEALELRGEVFLRNHHLDQRRDTAMSDLLQSRLQLRKRLDPPALCAERLREGEIVPGRQDIEGGELAVRGEGVQVDESLLDGVAFVAQHEDHGVALLPGEAGQLLADHHEAAVARHHKRPLAATERHAERAAGLVPQRSPRRLRHERVARQAVEVAEHIQRRALAQDQRDLVGQATVAQERAERVVEGGVGEAVVTGLPSRRFTALCRCVGQRVLARKIAVGAEPGQQAGQKMASVTRL